MKHWQTGWRRLTRVWRRDSAVNVDDELAFHFAQKTAELTALGLSADEARQRAEAEFGDVDVTRARLREIDERLARKQSRAAWWESVAQDLKYVARTLRRAPAFTLTVVATLALGLGANAALFSVLDRLYLQVPAGVTNAAHMHRVYQFMANNGRPFTRRGLSYPEIRALRAVAPEGVTFASFRASRVRLGRTSDAPEVGATSVEGDYFGLAGVGPALGRFFSPDERRIEGLSLVAVISQQLWRAKFGGDSGVIGRGLDLGSHRHVIIGVAGGGFRGTDLDVSDVWVPMNTDGTLKGRDPAWYENKNNNGISVLSYVGTEAAVPVFNARATRALRIERLSRDSNTTTFLAPLLEARAGESYGKELAITTRLGGVAAVILLIACANVVNLLLARASSRKREIAVRLALGVSRRRLLSQLMIESATLALLAGIVALAVAYAAATALRTLLLPDIHWGGAVLNLRVALFTSVLALLTGFIAGLAPALQASAPDLSNALKSSVRDGGQRRSRMRTTLLVAQAALSVVLLVGAGVFVRSLRTVEGIDIGYDTTRLVYVTVGYDRELENRTKEIQRRLPELAERLRKIAGVENVALTANIPMYGFSFTELHLPGRDSLPPGNGDRFLSVVSPEYFATVGTRVLRGRPFTSGDGESSEPVVVVDENLAKNFWPDQEALNKCVIVGTLDTPCRRVVGVVSTSHYGDVIEKPSMHYYLPLAQAGENGGANVVVLRTSTSRRARVGALATRELSEQLGEWSRVRVRTMDEVLAPEMRPWRVGAALFTSAGLLALLVAAVGVYSSVAYTISQRTQEMGVRVALGATTTNIMQLVVTDGVRVVAIGVAIGVVTALALGSLVSSMLYETSPRDPFVVVTSTMTLLLVAVVACSIPAWRASRVDPLDALRAE